MKLSKNYEFEMLIDSIEPKLLNSIGDNYAHGIGVQIDSEKAIYCYEQAIEKGCNISAITLSRMYEHGQGVPKNIEKAFKYYKIATKQKTPEPETNAYFFNHPNKANIRLFKQGKKRFEDALIKHGWCLIGEYTGTKQKHVIMCRKTKQRYICKPVDFFAAHKKNGTYKPRVKV